MEKNQPSWNAPEERDEAAFASEAKAPTTLLLRSTGQAMEEEIGVEVVVDFLPIKVMYLP